MIDMMIETTAFASRLVDRPNIPFLVLFIFRYLRLVVHVLSFWLYRPAPVLPRPTLTSSDCTVIIPTVEPDNHDFVECLESVLRNAPKAILVVTVGAELRAQALSIVAPFQQNHPRTAIRVIVNDEANKRRQVCRAVPLVTTDITVLVDDHVFWPSANFLNAMLAPFEDPLVGVVGTNKRVRRLPTGFGFTSFWNIIGALYLERHNFELRATNAIDGGVFVISGRTAAHRTCILQDPDFIQGFTNERFFFGKFGPLNADDDNFITRWEVRQGWKIKFQYCEDAMIETTLGTYPKFLSQCLRWARTTWRSNSASLFTDRTVWWTQPWCVYAVYFTSFFNFALFYDASLAFTLTQTNFVNKFTIMSLAIWILISKMIKTIAYFRRHPADVIYLPACIFFAYYHSFIKLYAGLTFWVTAWGGRNLAAIDQQSGAHDNGDDGVDGANQQDASIGERQPLLHNHHHNHAKDIEDDASESNDRFSSDLNGEYMLAGQYGSSNRSTSVPGRYRRPSMPSTSMTNNRSISTPRGTVRFRGLQFQPEDDFQRHIPPGLKQNVGAGGLRRIPVSRLTNPKANNIDW